MSTSGAETFATSETISAPVLRQRWPRWIAAGTVLFILVMVATRWDARTGFTSLLRFGEDYRTRQIPAVASLPVAIKPNRGYDGEFYGQLAVDPSPLDPAVQLAMDNPGYRMRRMLLPLLAHVLGGGDAWRTLHVYAFINVATWLAACLLLWRIIAPADVYGTATCSAACSDSACSTACAWP